MQARKLTFGAAQLMCALLLFSETSLFAQINFQENEQRPRNPQLILLEHARNTLVDPDMRREAVESLLVQGDPHVIGSLERALKPGSDVMLQRIIAQALSSLLAPVPQTLEGPLLTLMAHVEDPLAAEIGLALGRYSSDEVVNALIAVARDESAREPHRRAAISALSFRRSKRVADLLMKLTEVDHPLAVGHAAYDAMGQLTGMPRLGRDVKKWNSWWQEHRSLSPQRWYAALAENFAKQTHQLTENNLKLRERLLETKRLLYHATDEEKREALLVSMLTSPSAVTRLLAIELMAQRFIDERVFGAELVQAAIGVLDDPSVAVRASAARVLLAINTPEGADVMARRLVDGSETATQVLRVYLRMMADRPHARAIDRAMVLFADHGLRDDAAGVLATAAQRGLLTEQQHLHLHMKLQGRINSDQPPRPKIIELLGYVGDDADWQHIKQWLDSDKDEVKLAATRAWARSSRPLDVLAERASDPTVQTIFISAANTRGQTAQTLFTLIKLKPESEHSIAAWHRAIDAVAARVSSADAMHADKLMTEANAPLALRELVLTSALNKALPDGEQPDPVELSDPSQLISLLLTRADVRLQSGESKTALNDLAVIDAHKWPLTDQQSSKHNALAMAAWLHSGDHGKAFAIAAQVLDTARQSGEQVFRQAATAIARLVLNAADRHVQANQPDQALFLITQLRETVGSEIPDALLKRLKQLEDSANKLQPVMTAESTSKDDDL